MRLNCFDKCSGAPTRIGERICLGKHVTALAAAEVLSVNPLAIHLDLLFHAAIMVEDF